MGGLCSAPQEDDEKIQNEAADPNSEAKFRGIDNFPSIKDMAATKLELPEGALGHVAAEELPVSDSLVQFSITKPKFQLTAKKDVWSVLGGDGQPYADGVYLSLSNPTKVVKNQTRIVIRDKDEKPLILAAQQPREALTTYFILSKTPLHEGDEKVETEDDVDFYPMFKVRNIDNEDYGRKVSVWKGPKEYVDMLHVERVRAGPHESRGAGLKALKLLDPNDHDKVYAVLVKRAIKERIDTKMIGWDCLVAPGTDIGMMLALSAVMDEMVGWFSEFRAAA